MTIYLRSWSPKCDRPSALDLARDNANRSRTKAEGQVNCTLQLLQFSFQISRAIAGKTPLREPFRIRDLSTVGQPGLRSAVYPTSRALQRTGAWGRIPRPFTEAEFLDALRQVPPPHLAKERRRLCRHQERFRPHTRSTRRIDAQFEELRRQ